MITHIHKRRAYIDGYQGYFSSINRLAGTEFGDGKNKAKWGVGIFIKEEIRLGTIWKGDKNLKGRLILVPLVFEAEKNIKPVWIVGIYAPVRRDKQSKFWDEVTVVLAARINKAEKMIVVGDLNNRIQNNWFAQKKIHRGEL